MGRRKHGKRGWEKWERGRKKVERERGKERGECREGGEEGKGQGGEKCMEAHCWILTLHPPIGVKI